MPFGNLLISRALLFGFRSWAAGPSAEAIRRRAGGPYRGQRDIPGVLNPFALHAIFSFRAAEHDLIARRRGDSVKLGLSLHIGFVRMGRAAAEQRAGCGGGCFCWPITAAKTSAGD